MISSWASRSELEHHMAASGTILQVENLPHRKLSALKRKAQRMGLTAGTYVRQLIEDDLDLDRKAQNTSLDELAAPFRKALKGVADDEIDRMVEAAHTRQSTSRRKR
jgi:hypothetical protein